MIGVPGYALAHVRGDEESVLLLGLDMERGLCLHRDGSLSTPPLKDIIVNPIETAYRFDTTVEELTEKVSEVARDD